MKDSDPAVIQQFPFLKHFENHLKAVEYRTEAYLEISYLPYVVRTNWTKNGESIKIDFGFKAKGIKEIVPRIEWMQRSILYKDLMREIMQNDDTIALPPSKDEHEAHFRKLLVEQIDLYGGKLCNIIYLTEYQTNYHLESEEGKAIFNVWRNGENRFTKIKVECEKGPKSEIYSEIIERLLQA